MPETETSNVDAVVRRISTVVAVGLLAAAVTIPYAGERAYRRWLKRSDLLEWLRSDLSRAMATLVRDRESASDVAAILGGAIQGIEGMTSARRRR